MKLVDILTKVATEGEFDLVTMVAAKLREAGVSVLGSGGLC